MDLFSNIDSGDKEAEAQKPKIYSVIEISREIRFLLEKNFRSFSITGEISNYTISSSGHIYFTLKDELAQIRCVIWKSNANGMSFSPKNGMKVVITGRISLYEKSGQYQISVDSIRPEGFGELQLAFEKLKQKLFAEGLFDDTHKIDLPEFPLTIGVITSPTGAAIHDIISTVRRRMPSIDLILRPAKVQGPGAAEDIARAIEEFDEWGGADVILVGRGGGSLEDLWAFNEEIVARAIFACKTPIVSAVGHEVDFSIADFVADIRAATPTAAAELVTPELEEILKNLSLLKYGLESGVSDHIENLRARLKAIQNHYAFRQPENIIAQHRQFIDELERRLAQTLMHRYQLSRQKLDSISTHLNSLNPRNTLKRGYAMVRQNSHLVQNARLFESGKSTEIEFFDGEVIVK